jgi:hypothetical protein
MHIVSIKTIAMLGAAAMLLSGCGHKAVPEGGGGNPNPVKPGAVQQINLIWKKSTNEWKVKLPGDPNEEDPKSAVTHLAKGVGPTMFELDIQGSSPLPTFKDDALTVWEGDKSNPGGGKATTQILGPVLTKKGTLVFWDLNQGDPVKVNYSLHFNNGVPDADPIIDNGGGTNLE